MPASIFDDSFTLVQLFQVARTCPRRVLTIVSHFCNFSGCKNLPALMFDDSFTLLDLLQVAKTCRVNFSRLFHAFASLWGRKPNYFSRIRMEEAMRAKPPTSPNLSPRPQRRKFADWMESHSSRMIPHRPHTQFHKLETHLRS